MRKDDFLRLTANFIDWLCNKERNADLHHEWTAPNRGYRLVAPAPGETFRFSSLASAREQYFWDGQGFGENAIRLENLRTNLRQTIQLDRHNALNEVLTEILRWGGVHRYPRIREWVLGYDGPCLRQLQDLLQETIHGLRPLDRLHERAQGPTADRLVVDSGLTKVYALLVDGFCMFDSRVACGLQTLLAKYEQENGLQLDSECRIPALSQRRRVQGMPRLRQTRSLERLLWNVKVSWLIQGLLQTPPFDARNWTVRDIEASLFMYGYAPAQ